MLPDTLTPLPPSTEPEEPLALTQLRLDAALSAGEIATWAWDLVSDRIVPDARLARLFGISPAEASDGRRELYFRAIHPDDRSRVTDAIERAVAKNEPYEVEYRVSLLDGSHRWLQSRGKVERDAAGNAVSLPGVVVDISEQMERRRQERFLSELTAYTHGLLDPEAVLYQVAEAVGRYTNAHRCLYIEIDDVANTLTVRRDYVQSAAIGSMAGIHPLDAFGPPIVASLRAGNVTQSEDTEIDPRLSPQNRATFRATNFRAFLGVPLHRAGQWVAVLALHYAQPRTWTSDEAVLLSAVMERTWLAVENARLFRETQRRAEREALLNRIGAAVRGATEPEAILRETVAVLGKGLGADRCYFVRYDQTRDTARVFPEWQRDGADWEPLTGRVFQMSSFSVDRHPAYKEGNTHTVDDVVAYAPEEAAPLLALPIRSLIRVPIETGDQMTALTVAMAHTPRHWEADEIRLVENVTVLVRSALESAQRQQRERNIARQLQEALLPAVPLVLPGVKIASFYRPALDEAGVGGDFFDVFEVENQCTAFVVADVSGKGLAAAQQVATIRNMLRFALYQAPSVAEAATNLHNVLVEHDLLIGFATLFVCVYDHTQRTVTYVNCGQEAGLIWRTADNTVDPLPATGPVLGGFAAPGGYTQKTVLLSPGDVLALFTDGLTEVGPHRKDMLGEQGVSDFLRSCCADNVLPAKASDPQVIAECLIECVDRFARGGIRDDIALLVATVTAERTPQLA